VIVEHFALYDVATKWQSKHQKISIKDIFENHQDKNNQKHQKISIKDIFENHQDNIHNKDILIIF